MLSCASKQKQSTTPDSKYDYRLNQPDKQLKNYSFSPESPIESRIKNTPDIVLHFLREYDQKPDYENYSPTSAEKDIIIHSINKLPDLHKKILKERLIGIYFIENFLGSGWADWVLDENKKIYTYLAFNPDVLKNDISQWVTHKENTCFVQNNPDLKVEIDCGTEYNGFLYILLHESTHIIDYIKVITPFVELSLAEILKMERKPTEYSKEIWLDYYKPKEQYDYSFRKNVTFYGFGGGPKINISDATNVYKQLESTPFVSIYGSKSWAEDLAEFLTFYHLTQKLNQPYIITVYKKDKSIYSCKPMESPRAKERFSLMEQFY